LTKSPALTMALPPAKQSFQMNTSGRRKIDVKDVFNQVFLGALQFRELEGAANFLS
jgi:hypothetical protein